jgi:hypothetical protein
MRNEPSPSPSSSSSTTSSSSSLLAAFVRSACDAHGDEDVTANADVYSLLAKKLLAVEAPAIAIEDYIARIAAHTGCSEQAWVFACAYLQRIVAADTSITLNALSVHRLTLVAVVLASK